MVRNTAVTSSKHYSHKQCSHISRLESSDSKSAEAPLSSLSGSEIAQYLCSQQNELSWQALQCSALNTNNTLETENRHHIHRKKIIVLFFGD